ncbi:hypothetical protein DFH07DRAFT_544259 [Mycena maculata]|uniref:F-box domain-containing protein n=1 Tax=Mycena maculata TaxID=230809 RepID=A0AAD7IY80_9AGAR|nr:hypothetical protein DFH07DRAFT_544259 [Mycena maculata]
MSSPQDLNRMESQLFSEGREDGRANLSAGNESPGRLSALQHRLDDTDEEIAGTIAHIERLRFRRTDILAEMNRARAPFLSLPPELICEIFVYCLPPPRTLPSPRDAPLLLGQVSRDWRNISLSLPVLWNHISVPVVLAAEPQNAPFAALLDLWIERAASCTLSVALIQPVNAQQDETPRRARCPVFRTIRHASHRYRELEIVRRLEDFPALLHRDDPWYLPELVKLTMLLSHGGRHPSSFPSNALANVMAAPALREVHLMGFTPNSLSIPWGQLTTARVENLFPMEVLQTLAKTTILTDGTFTLWPTQSFRLPNPAILMRLLHLTSLTLSGEFVTGLLDYLDLPALTRFAISFGADDDFTPLASFLARTSTLMDVAIEARGALGAADFATCLEPLGGVMRLELSLHTGIMNGDFPRALSASTALLPNLKHLIVKERIDRYHEPNLDPAAVLQMLFARKERGMQSFCLVSTHPWGAIHPGFAALAEEGMEIELRTHGSGPFLCVYFNSARRPLTT